MDERLSYSQQILENLRRRGASLQKLQFSRGQIVQEPDEPAVNFHFIEQGEIRLYHVVDEVVARLLDILGPGDWFGAAALAHLPKCGKRAVSTSQSVLYAVPITELRQELSENGPLALQILGDMARRLSDAWTEGSELLFEDCRFRLIKTLLRYSNSAAARHEADEVVLNITHAQLANAVGAARETISLCLTSLRHENIVQTGRNQLKFKPERLREVGASR
jgi:CRP/FNR family transcriptional regulator, cyclic AMP receptor protein